MIIQQEKENKERQAMINSKNLLILHLSLVSIRGFFILYLKITSIQFGSNLF